MIPYSLMYNLHRYNDRLAARRRRERADRLAGIVVIAILAVAGLLVMVMR